MLYKHYTTQAELDAQYDVEKSVDDFMVYANTYIESSANARKELACDLDIAYGPTRDEHLDLFFAAGQESSGKAPILIFVHGGYWRMLSSKEFSCVAYGPNAAGIHLVNVNYSLAPKVSIAEITRQIYAAVAWCWHNAEEFGGDRDRIYISGHSAGGHLSAMALLNDWQGEYGLPNNVIKGGFLISGLYDLSPLRYSFIQPAIQLTGDIINRYSPQFLIKSNSANIIVSVGGAESDEFQRQSYDFLDAWQKAGNSGRFFTQPTCNHFDAIYGFGWADTDLCRQLCDLMHVPQVNLS